MDDDEARLRELERFSEQMDRELEARLEQMADEFDRMMHGAACDAEGRAALLRWCGRPLHLPPRLAYPHGLVPISVVKDWYRAELQRALVEAEGLMRACAAASVRQYIHGEPVEPGKVH